MPPSGGFAAGSKRSWSIAIRPRAATDWPAKAAGSSTAGFSSATRAARERGVEDLVSGQNSMPKIVPFSSPGPKRMWPMRAQASKVAS